MSWKNMSAFFNSRVLITLLIIFLGILPLAAQSQAPVQTIPGKLTLAEAENLLLQRNLTILASRYQIEASRAARLIASYKPNPVLTVGAEQFPFYSPLADSYPRFFSTNPDAGAQPTYTLRFDKITERGGKREIRTDLADFQLKTAEAQMLDAVRTQLFQLRQAFNNAILARENLKLAEETEQQYGETERLTQVRLENGDVPAFELYRIRAGRLQFQQAVLQANTSYQQATSDILNLLAARTEQVIPRAVAQSSRDTLLTNIKLDPNQSTTGPAIPDSLRNAALEVIGGFDNRPVTQTLTELRDIALSQRPDVIAARNTFEATNKGVLLAQAQLRRDIDVGYEYQRVGNDNSLGVVLQVPLFLYNNNQAAIKQSEAQRDAAAALLRQAELQAVTDVEKAYRAYQSARSVLDLYNSENLGQVEKLKTISTFSFHEGAASLLELLDAQRTYNQSITSYNQASADYQMSLWQLEQATGRPLRLGTTTTDQ
jgi:cobalt-zinc-cadmium efflux system outer membrane protein